MFLDINGIPTNFPLYDQEGNLIPDSVDKEWFSEEANDEVEYFEEFMKIMRDALLEVNNTCNLEVCDNINIYNFDDNPDKEYYTVTLFGGLNGTGSWSDYLKVLSNYLTKLEEQFEDVWVRKFNIDVTDDVFDVEIAVVPSKVEVETVEDDEVDSTL